MSSTLNNDMLPRTSFQIFHGSLFCWILLVFQYPIVWPPGRHLDWRFLLIGHVSLCRLAFRLPTVFVLWNERERPGSERLTWLKRTGSWPWEKSKRQRIGRSRGFVWLICRWNWIFLSFFLFVSSLKKIYSWNVRQRSVPSSFCFPRTFWSFSFISQEKRKTKDALVYEASSSTVRGLFSNACSFLYLCRLYPRLLISMKVKG